MSIISKTIERRELRLKMITPLIDEHVLCQLKIEELEQRKAAPEYLTYLKQEQTKLEESIIQIIR